MIRDARRCAATLLVASSTFAAAASAQVIDTDSLRAAYRAQAEETAREVAAAAAVFTNPQLPPAQRLAAVAAVAAFEDEAAVERTIAIVFDPAEPVAVRARAVQLIGSRAAVDHALLIRLLELAAQPDQPLELRRATMVELEAALFSWHAGHDGQDRVLPLLRRLAQDPDPQVRRPALRVLAAHGDDEALRLLEQGLRSPDAALLPPAEAVRLLGLVDPAAHYPVLRQILDRPPDPDTRIAAIRMLAGDAGSRDRITRILLDPAERLVPRQAALAALAAGDPQGFPPLVLPLVGDESAPRDLRLRAITTVELHRTTRDQAALRARRADPFDRRIEQLAETSADAQVRAAATRYLTRTRVPR